MKRTVRHIVFLSILAVLTMAGCKKTARQIESEKLSREVRIGIDESLEPVFRQHIHAFEQTYPNARVKAYYLPENDLFRSLIQDSLVTIVAARKLRVDEYEALKKQNVTPKHIPVGYDALALLVHKDNPVQQLDTAVLHKILNGEIQNWSELNGAEKGIRLLIAGTATSVARYVQSQFTQKTTTAKISAKKSASEVIEAVALHPEVVGIIGIALISDVDDTEMQGKLSEVSVLKLQGRKLAQDSVTYFYPSQYALKLHTYPLERTLFAISRDPGFELGTRFVNFVMGDIGQRILLKAEILPAKMPERIVEMPLPEVEK